MKSDFDGLVEYLYVTCLPPSEKTSLRGANVAAGTSIADLVELRSWNANVIRYRIVPSVAFTTGADAIARYEQEFLFQVQRAVFECMKILFYCAEAGLHVIVDLQHPPGWIHRDPLASARVLTEEWARKLFLQSWDLIASQLSAYTSVWAYELLGLPSGSSEDWRELALGTMERVRRYDSSARFVIQAVEGAPERLSELKPFPSHLNVVFGVHMYAPWQYTHQSPSRLLESGYPGRLGSKVWNVRRLKSLLAPARRYQRKHGVPILISEFGAVRYAKGAAQYMGDIVRLSERLGFNWIYSEFRGENAFDVERGALPHSPRLVYSEAQEMIRASLGRNAA